MSEELKPCPFCGCKAVEDRTDNWFWVECTECNAASDYYQNDYECVDRWNTRAEPVNAVEQSGVPGCCSEDSDLAHGSDDVQELVEAAKSLADAINQLPVEDMVGTFIGRNGIAEPELLGYEMQCQGEWDQVRRAAEAVKALIAKHQGGE